MTSDDLDDVVGRLVEEYLQQVELGREPRISEFAQRYPEVKDILETILPALRVAEQTGPEAGRAVNESGRQLGDFRILRQIGRGGMGIVYEAEQQSMNRRVALKVLPLAGLVDERKIRRFQNEVRAVAALNHPNIVPVFMVGEERGTHYYAMQLIRGRSLSEIVASLRRDRAQGNWPGGSFADHASKADRIVDAAERQANGSVDHPHDVDAGSRETVAELDEVNDSARHTARVFSQRCGLGHPSRDSAAACS